MVKIGRFFLYRCISTTTVACYSRLFTRDLIKECKMLAQLHADCHTRKDLSTG